MEWLVCGKCSPVSMSPARGQSDVAPWHASVLWKEGGPKSWAFIRWWVHRDWLLELCHIQTLTGRDCDYASLGLGCFSFISILCMDTYGSTCVTFCSCAGGALQCGQLCQHNCRLELSSERYEAFSETVSVTPNAKTLGDILLCSFTFSFFLLSNCGFYFTEIHLLLKNQNITLMRPSTVKGCWTFSGHSKKILLGGISPPSCNFLLRSLTAFFPFFQQHQFRLSLIKRGRSLGLHSKEPTQERGCLCARSVEKCSFGLINLRFMRESTQGRSTITVKSVERASFL